tara:strand:- start:3327 stop:7442 length:4116 start_codon:yes stop_codon:yes gene_type:complete
MDYRDSFYEKHDAHVEKLEEQQRQQKEAEENEDSLVDAVDQNEKDIPEVKESKGGFMPDAGENRPAHEGELGRAVVGGMIDTYNSIVSLPKFFDKKFYQPSDPLKPYKYESPLLINYNPIMKTQWGKFLRGAAELYYGMRLTGGLASATPLKGVIGTAQKTMKGRMITEGAKGFTYDIISNQSQEQNMTAALIEYQPRFAPLLNHFATTEDMSPAHKAFMNGFEGLGVGILGDTFLEGAGWTLRSLSKDGQKALKTVKAQSKLDKSIKSSSDVEYKAKTEKVEVGAKKAYENSLKTKRKVTPGSPHPTDAKKIRGYDGRWVTQKFFDKTNESRIGGNKIRKEQGLEELPVSKRIPTWDQLTKEQQNTFKQTYADKNNIDWGEERNLGRRLIKQDKANKELAVQQLEQDVTKGKPRTNPAYYKGGDISDNQALSSSSKPMKGVRDMVEIRNKTDQKYGSPRGTLTEATIRKLEYNAPGTSLRERDALAKKLEADPAYQKIYGGSMPEAISEDLAEAQLDLAKFINDSGHSRLIDIDQEDVLKHIKAKDANKETVIEGLGVLNKSQLIATDTVLGQMLYEARDLAKAALSVSDQIDIAADGSVLDGILSRYAGIARMRKETSLLSSFELRKFNSGVKDSIEQADIRGKASDAAANEIASFKKLLKEDVDDDLMETFLHFTAVSNGSKQGFKDFTSFMKNRLHGYKDGNKYQRNAIINELQTMGVNSMLSGPKTPVRALIGTGLGTIMRPVATIIGAMGDAQTVRGAFSSLGAMVDARNDAWRKAVADFQSYTMHEEGFRGFTQSKGDKEWSALGSFFEKHGDFKDQAAYHIADQLRGVNKLPFLNYGPRTMKAMDTYFTQIIGRGRLRQIAFDDVWDRAKISNKNLSDQDFDELVKAAEGHFEGKVFTKDGQVSDEMALFAADEAKLTQDLQGFAKDLDTAFDKMPFLRPFFLFARTGVNALKMTSKYTPILNQFIGEHVDIMTKAWDDPSMLKYGIKNQRDLELAKSVMKGRMAIGYGFTSTAALMAVNGQITGNGPPDRRLRNSWMQAGWQPRSIKIGDKYVSYEAIEPFNMFFSFMADVVDSQSVMGDTWAGNHFGKASYLISANVVNKSFLAGLLQLQDLLTSQGGDAPRVAANFINNQIPLSGLRNEVGKVLSPGMRELESGFWQSIGNRNLWADVLTNGSIIPYRYDILNGEKIRDWDPVTRLTNAILPFNINIGTNQTREWLFRSGVNFKQTFNTGPDGQSLEGHPNLKSQYQFYLGQQNVEAQLEPFFEHPEIQESIETMEKHRSSGRTHQAHQTMHGKELQSILREAKKRAWNMLLENSPEGRALDQAHKLNKLGDKARIQGNYERDEEINQKVQEFEKQMKVK